MDRAGKAYWDRTWLLGGLPTAVDPTAPGVWNHIARRFHAWFTEVLAGLPRGARLLEIGCARSPWLPYFARHFGCSVTGLDYSEIGAEMAREVLRGEQLEGEIVCADLFAPPERLLARFDLVVSFGVMEHFDDTAGALAAAARLLKPGGRLITEIPNMVGLMGWLQRVANRSVYDIHVPLDREALSRALDRAGLEVERADYLVLTQFGMVNLGEQRSRLRLEVSETVLWALKVVSAAFWTLESQTRLHPGVRSAGYILAAARKPAAP